MSGISELAQRTAGEGVRAAPPRHLRLGRRRQVDADRPSALRHEAGVRRPDGGGRGDERAPRRRLRQPRAADRRPARRARAGDHDRRRLPRLRHPEAPLPARRRPRPRAVHAQHGHGRLDRRRRGRPRRRAQGRDRADAPAHADHVAPRRPPPRLRGQQDGSRRLRRGAVQRDRAGARRADRRTRRQGRGGDPDRRAARRQRRRALRPDALVAGRDAAAAPRGDRARGRPQPRGPPLPGAVGDPADVRRVPRLPRLRRPGRGRHLARGRRRPRPPVGAAHARRVGRDVRRPDRRGDARACR